MLDTDRYKAKEADIDFTSNAPRLGALRCVAAMNMAL